MKTTLLGLLLLACSPAIYGQTDDFPDQLQKGCATKEACHTLVAEAEARVARCRDNTIGYLRCSDTQADLRIARSFVERHERAEEAERERQRDAQLAAQRAEETLQRQRRLEQQAEQERRQEEERTRLLQDRAAQEAARQAEIQAQETQDLERLRLLGASGRDKELRSCYRNSYSCRRVLAQLMSAADDDAEKKRLVQLDQQLANAPEPSTGSRAASGSTSGAAQGSGRVRCNDGSLSPSCVCGRSLRGCCSHHGGVAGCD